jgi:hypothetical protein
MDAGSALARDGTDLMASGSGPWATLPSPTMMLMRSDSVSRSMVPVVIMRS